MNKNDIILERIIMHVCSFYGIKREELFKVTRVKDIVKARAVVYYIAYNSNQMTYQFIGNRFNKDHATVLHSVKQLSNLMDTYRDIRIEVKRIEQLVSYGIGGLIIGDVNLLETKKITMI
jgi:chromosomal replication initiator protein